MTFYTPCTSRMITRYWCLEHLVSVVSDCLGHSVLSFSKQMPKAIVLRWLYRDIDFENGSRIFIFFGNETSDNQCTDAFKTISYCDCSKLWKVSEVELNCHETGKMTAWLQKSIYEKSKPLIFSVIAIMKLTNFPRLYLCVCCEKSDKIKLNAQKIIFMQL